MRNALTFLILGLTLAIFAGQGRAERSYVTDSIKITVRTGPSLENKIIAMLPSGEPVEMLENQNDWNLIRFLGPGGTPKEGWVLRRFLMSREPWERQAKAFQKENQSLKERIEELEKQLKETSERERMLADQMDETSQGLRKLKTDYEALKKGAANYLKLKNEYEMLQTTLRSTRERLEKLTNENESLKISQNIKWFVTGALVLFGGWLIGLSMGRLQRRRRPSQYSLGR